MWNRELDISERRIRSEGKAKAVRQAEKLWLGMTVRRHLEACFRPTWVSLQPYSSTLGTGCNRARRYIKPDCVVPPVAPHQQRHHRQHHHQRHRGGEVEEAALHPR